MRAFAVDMMRVFEVKHGPFGAVGGCRGIGLSCARASQHMRRRCERAAQTAGPRLVQEPLNSDSARLNTHVSSVVLSQFNMPAEVSAAGQNERWSVGRLSSFGFSGTIAHGAFACLACSENKMFDAASHYRA